MGDRERGEGHTYRSSSLGMAVIESSRRAHMSPLAVRLCKW